MTLIDTLKVNTVTWCNNKMEVYLPFQDKWKAKMLGGQKVCTSRVKPFGKVGDTFTWFNYVFKITAVEPHKLDYVAKRLFKEEGCDRPSEFITVWEEIHPIRGFMPTQTVYTHFFKVLGQKSNIGVPEQFR